MNVGWLCDDPGYVGGAELTQAEFRAAAPDGVEVIDCPPGEVAEADRYVVQNCTSYGIEDLRSLTMADEVVKYVHDLWPDGDSAVRAWLLENATLIFCSPLHLQGFHHAIPDWTVTKVVPPALDLDRFKPTRQVQRNGSRSGTCSIAQWRNPGKGAQALAEWAAENGPVDVYGDGDFKPHAEDLEDKEPLDPSLVPQTLWKYSRFCFLPFDLEPFCRSVAEAWAAGCQIVTNDLIGARYFIENDPEALFTAAEDFWGVVCD